MEQLLNFQTLPKNWVASHIEEITVPRRCGIHPWEKHPERPNLLTVSIKLFGEYPLKNGKFIDYDIVRNHILTWPSLPHTDTLESIADELIALAFSDELVVACWVKLSKPIIFAEARGAGIELFRVRD
jgi:dihydroneopterin aldolase